jgi:hypothetical protein
MDRAKTALICQSVDGEMSSAREGCQLSNQARLSACAHGFGLTVDTRVILAVSLSSGRGRS